MTGMSARQFLTVPGNNRFSLSSFIRASRHGASPEAFRSREYHGHVRLCLGNVNHHAVAVDVGNLKAA